MLQFHQLGGKTEIRAAYEFIPYVLYERMYSNVPTTEAAASLKLSLQSR